MERDLITELDELKKEQMEIKALLMRFLEGETKSKQNNNKKQFKTVQPICHMHPDPRLQGLMDELTEKTDEENRSGSVTYLGVFSSGGRQSNWIKNTISTDPLLSLIENRSADTVLQSIGSNDRLTILLALLRKPMSVASLVEQCEFNTSGQVYHHLKPLLAADLIFEVEQGERGVYAVKPHRVQGIIMLLAGIADLLNAEHSEGQWG